MAIDLGNRRLKAGCFTGQGQLGRTLTLDHDRVAFEWSAWVSDGEPVAFAVLSSVCGAERLAPLLDVIQAALGVPVQVNPDSGLTLDVRSPETVGRDRLFAARGALARGFEAAIVVDAGTALTVDAVVRASSSAAVAGTFLGGAIAPGPELVARSLAEAAQLYEIHPHPGAPALGKDTRSALEAGVAHTVAGAAVRLAGRMRSESGLVAAPVILTGGARSFVGPALVEAGYEPLEAPHLVLEGLAACPWLTGPGIDR